MSRITLVLSSFLFACGDGAADPAKTDTAADESLLTGQDLAGDWDSIGCEAYDNGSGGQTFLTRSFSLTPERWDLTFTVFGDADCTYGLFTAEIEGPYTLGGAASVSGATNGDFAFTTNVWTPLVADLATTFEQAGCGSGEWEVGVGQDVTATGCIGVAHPISECPVEYDIVRITDDELYFGARVTDMCVESGRPTALAPYPVR